MQKDAETQDEYFSDITDAENEYYEWQQKLLEERYAQEERYAMAYEAMATGVFNLIKATGDETYNSIYETGVGTVMSLTEAYNQYALETGEAFTNLGTDVEQFTALMSDANEILNIASDTLRSWMQGNLAYDDNTELSIGSGNALTTPTADANDVSGWGTGNNGDRSDINAVNNTNKVLSSNTSKSTQQLRSSEIERTIGVMINREAGGLSTENQRSYLIDLLNAAMQYGNAEYSYSALKNMLSAVQNGYSGRSLSSLLTGNVSSDVTYAPSKLALSADSSIDAMNTRADEIERTLSKIQSLESSGAGTTDQREYLYQVIAAALKYGITGYTDKRLNDIRAGLNYGQSGDVLASYHSGKNKEELAVILEDETILTKSDVNMLKSNFSMMADVVNSAKGFVKATMAGLDNMFSINRYAPVVAGGNTYSFRFNNVTRQDAQYIETSITDMLENVDSDGGK